jgi:hypothetical protein
MTTYKLLDDDSVLLAQPNLIHKFGRTGATFLNQIHYWLKNNKVGVIHDNQHWIYNTAKEWGRQICLSERQIHHYLKKFSAMGIILVKKLNAKHYDRTNYITINYTALNAFNSTPDLIVSQSAVSAVSKKQKARILYTKITNKENNKSKGQGDKEIKRVPSQSHVTHPVEQVQDRYFNPKERLSNKNTEHPLEKETLKRTTARDMLDLLQKAFPHLKALMNKDVAKNLVAAFNHKFSKNIRCWHNYLERLKSSVFIMSKGFILTLDWVLKFKTIDRILKGDLGVKDIPVTIDENAQQQEADRHVEGVEESDRCKRIRRSLIKAIGAPSYNSWFTRVNLYETHGQIKMKVKTQFFKDEIHKRFSHYLKSHGIEIYLSN